MSTRRMLALLLLIFVGLRLAGVQADAPIRFPGDISFELVIEPPAKSHEARKAALFGSFSTNDADDYQFWRVQAPAWVYPLAAWFSAFGVGWVQLRLFGLLGATVGFAAFLAILARELDGWRLAVGALLVAVSFYAIHFDRSGLLEPQVGAFSALCVLFLLLSLDRLPWLVAAHQAAALAFLTKQTGLYLVPLLLVVGVVATVRAYRRGAPVWEHGLVWAHAAALVAALGLYVDQEAYRRTVAWNYSHMVQAAATLKERPTRVPVGEALVRLVSWSRWRDGYLPLVPVALALALFGAVAKRIRRDRVTDLEWVGLLWFLSALAVLQATPHVRIRFSLILILPAALLGALGFRQLQEVTRRRTLLVAGVLLALALVHGTWQVAWLSTRSYDLQAVTETLSEELDEDDVVIGAFAAPLALGTRADHFYVKPPFNVRERGLAALGVTHVLLGSDDFTGRTLGRRFPRWRRHAEPGVAVELYGRRYRLYELTRPLGEP